MVSAPLPSRPQSRLRLRHSLAARITALVLLVLLGAVASAVVALDQLRAIQQGFDRMVEVYVVFNKHLADGHVQSQRIFEQVRTWEREGNGVPEEERELERDFEETFRLALSTRNDDIAKAQTTIDAALADPERFGAAEPRQELREIQDLLAELEELAARDEAAEPRQVLQDVRGQGQIQQKFKKIEAKSQEAIEQVRGEIQQAQVRTERLTVGLTLGVATLAVLVAVGVFLTLRPLRRLAEGVRKLGAGDWSQRVSPSGPEREDEVSQLAREFNHMAEALEERERRLLRGERLAAAGQLAAQITHEIRNPLSSVALNAELLEDELQGASPESRDLLAKIVKEVDRLTAVTEDYLSFARRPKPHLVPLDLREELHDLLDFMGQELEMAGIEVVQHLPRGPVWVMGDGNQLRQVFMNLVRNAQEAALDEERDPDRRPRIEVTMRCKDEQVVVVVQDDGPGIPVPAAEVDRIFEAFYTSKAKGTGLGLPTVQQIVLDHEGTVAVADTGPSGTAFEVRLPACAPEGGSVSSPASVPGQGPPGDSTRPTTRP
ncbi:sensor histidine kinase [Paraliomyxa miuraensis]|uniref:sensor histidine kinase n=1 Tax=Paraliomyxa miuraensis TaxID=376150 RepID=UPI00224EFDBC|nr:HAMP domain-containing sensor histidine kinase [Paraliomyxa miuraensis]MCX4242785.1 HAMP domain-containing histidine kinase [Paraliomyxa miuraensis]